MNVYRTIHRQSEISNKQDRHSEVTFSVAFPFLCQGKCRKPAKSYRKHRARVSASRVARATVIYSAHRFIPNTPVYRSREFRIPHGIGRSRDRVNISASIHDLGTTAAARVNINRIFEQPACDDARPAWRISVR